MRLSERGLIAEISRRSRPAPLNATKRWVIERANSWQAKRAHGKRQPPPANAGSHYFATFSNTQVIVKITHLSDVRNPTSVVFLRALRSRGEGLARIFPPPPGIKGGVLAQKGGEEMSLEAARRRGRNRCRRRCRRKDTRRERRRCQRRCRRRCRC